MPCRVDVVPRIGAILMGKNRQIWWFIATSILVVTGICYYGHRTARPNPPNPDQLLQLLLEGPTLEERERAAIALADAGKVAKEQMRQGLRDSRSPRIRAICIHGLGATWDYEHMDRFLLAMEDKSPEVRGQAAIIVARMIGRDRGYRADAPAVDRKRWVRYYRQDWQKIRSSPHVADLQQRLRESHETLP